MGKRCATAMDGRIGSIVAYAVVVNEGDGHLSSARSELTGRHRVRLVLGTHDSRHDFIHRPTNVIIIQVGENSDRPSPATCVAYKK